VIDDIRAIMWKEWRSLFRVRGSRLKAVLTLLTPLGVFGIWVPWDAGDHWLAGAPSAFAAVALPLMIALLVVPDSFAGERERHTMETLLASRLSDRAILFGKAGFAAGLAWGVGLAALVLGLIVYNLAHWNGAPQFYTPRVAFVDLSLGFVTATLSVGAGIYLSLRALTVQEAQQTMAAVLLLPPTILGPIALLVAQSNPDWTVRQFLARTDPTAVFLAVLGVLLVIDLLLLLAVLARFKRARLLN
jgi:ABC-2 type transport system permease protein